MRYVKKIKLNSCHTEYPVVNSVIKKKRIVHLNREGTFHTGQG